MDSDQLDSLVNSVDPDQLDQDPHCFQSKMLARNN